MTEEKRVKIFLALTSIHRKIENNEGKTKIKWYSEFMNQGIKNPFEKEFVYSIMPPARKSLVFFEQFFARNVTAQ